MHIKFYQPSYLIKKALRFSHKAYKLYCRKNYLSMEPKTRFIKSFSAVFLSAPSLTIL
jgi:hypothetical protein